MNGHDRTNSLTTGKKEIRDIDLIFKIFLRNGISVLIEKEKVANFVIPADMFQGIIHQPWVHIYRIVNRKLTFGFYKKIKNGHKHDREEQ
jgi:hypothetical protein